MQSQHAVDGGARQAKQRLVELKPSILIILCLLKD